MKNKIHYAVEALRDLDDIWDYIVTDLCNASAAERVVNDILDVVEQLENFSEMGALLASIANVDSDYRFIVSGNYLIFYRVSGMDVYVDHILYGRRDYLRILFADTQEEQSNN